jgi:hypothetical protein
MAHLGKVLGKIVFHSGTPAPEADGSYIIGEFLPDEGEPLPIAVKLEKTEPTPPPAAPHKSSSAQDIPLQFEFHVIRVEKSARVARHRAALRAG